MAHPNEDLLRRAYDAFARGDLDAYLAACTESISFACPAERGRRHLPARPVRVQHDPPRHQGDRGHVRETVLDVVANDTRGVVLARHEFERRGQRHGYNTAHVYRIDQGRLASFEEYPEDLYAFDAAWS